MGSCVTVTNPIHPLYGNSVTVRQIRKVGQETKVTVESPFGGFLSIPASETDLLTQQTSKTQKTEKFLPEKLLRLSEWVAAHMQFVTSEFSCVPEDQGVEHKKKNGTKASTTNPETRKRRTVKSSNKTHSRVSGQDTLHSTDTRGDNKE